MSASEAHAQLSRVVAHAKSVHFHVWTTRIRVRPVPHWPPSHLQHLCSVNRGELLEGPDRSTSELTVSDCVGDRLGKLYLQMRHRHGYKRRMADASASRVRGRHPFLRQSGVGISAMAESRPRAGTSHGCLWQRTTVPTGLRHAHASSPCLSQDANQIA